MNDSDKDQRVAAQGRRLAIGIVIVGVYWIAATWIGGAMGLTNRVRALLDLIALAGFGWVLWGAFQLWRARRDDSKG
ncbi:DUF5337 domain-containing protein [Ketogulonicigenium vulgare]|uniref:Uncharacterized protein n=1 Tax=Ketogulonicigenium vulgare (strain WSH-001) TaxID=759362 RepID=F9Y3W8_KETVW|nr:DUF5337 domain-containing protein [Ketogulonicigenium vulgare]ADO43374.1 conserved hypothetical protein [Ketogulonicigenium vulgare Y25]AEM41659.1 hypothetical protein KVU_1820 [Ketogulonicigenium vulgare WSH-001]ALJ81771.1 hypothetical protein KVH_11720 [Ketogulonicigenium vulgare]ANW35172.1 hypothetical protein KvSKV_11635 [Ketogulonicigenium vulgare]AOZ55409.1 hypothetical protein KVC_2407 [Ketogulonicigenium vulgare]